MSIFVQRPLILNFDQGDGDQSIFGDSFVAQSVGGFFNDDDGVERLMMKIITGTNAGKSRKIESRLTSSLREQIASRNSISVVVHSTGSRWADSPDEWIAIGMSAPEVIDRGFLK